MNLNGGLLSGFACREDDAVSGPERAADDARLLREEPNRLQDRYSSYSSLLTEPSSVLLSASRSQMPARVAGGAFLLVAAPSAANLDASSERDRLLKTEWRSELSLDR